MRVPGSRRPFTPAAPDGEGDGRGCLITVIVAVALIPAIFVGGIVVFTVASLGAALSVPSILLMRTLEKLAETGLFGAFDLYSNRVTIYVAFNAALGGVIGYLLGKERLFRIRRRGQRSRARRARTED